MKTILAFLLLAATTFAGGYTYRDGYYWSGGVAHTRYQQAYWSGCCWKYQYRYRPVNFDAAYSKEVTDVKYADPIDVSEKLLELAEMKIKYDAKLKERQQAADEVRKGLEALGMQAPSQSAYTAPSGYGAQSVTSGTTVYGYPSVNNVSSLYSDGVNLDAKLQAAQRTVDNLAKLVGEANAGNLKAIEGVAAGRDRAALVLAAAQLVSATPGVQTTTTTQAAASSTAAVTQPTSIASVISTRCAACHSASNPSGKSDLFPDGVDMSKWSTFSDQQWSAVVDAVLTGSMPKDAAALTASETREFLNARTLVE